MSKWVFGQFADTDDRPRNIESLGGPGSLSRIDGVERNRTKSHVENSSAATSASDADSGSGSNAVGRNESIEVGDME